MFVRFRETPYGLQVSLIQTRREGGKVRHEHIAGLARSPFRPRRPTASRSGGACMIVSLPSRIGSWMSRARSSAPWMSEFRCQRPTNCATYSWRTPRRISAFWEGLRRVHTDTIEGHEGVIGTAERAIAN